MKRCCAWICYREWRRISKRTYETNSIWNNITRQNLTFLFWAESRCCAVISTCIMWYWGSNIRCLVKAHQMFIWVSRAKKDESYVIAVHILSTLRSHKFSYKVSSKKILTLILNRKVLTLSPSLSLSLPLSWINDCQWWNFDKLLED